MTQKSLGQIAREVETSGYVRDWSEVHEQERAHWERIAAAVALECSRICIEIAAEHMRQAKDFEYSSMCDYRQQAAIECAEAIREAISCSGKEAP